jgi:hypothetical protein
MFDFGVISLSSLIQKIQLNVKFHQQALFENLETFTGVVWRNFSRNSPITAQDRYVITPYFTLLNWFGGDKYIYLHGFAQ